jgi:2,3-bisphosphoglycerate-dependent phosphoglycerate mutase
VESAILARHGESEFSVRGAMNGDPGVSCPLTDEGKLQARRLGEALRNERIDLCVVTEFQRTTQTADLALMGRDLPRLVVPELNDIHVGDFEGGALEAYRAWAREHSPVAVPPGGGESRAQVAARYARGFRIVLARPERAVLVVAHGLPIRYLLLAVEGKGPRPFVANVEYATPYELTRSELEEAVADLERWASSPAWAG